MRVDTEISRAAPGTKAARAARRRAQVAAMWNDGAHVNHIAAAMETTTTAVRELLRSARKDGLDVAERTPGGVVVDAAICHPQPVTVSKRAGDLIQSVRYASVADWRARRGGVASVKALPKPDRNRCGVTFRERMDCGRLSPWLSVHPSRADSVPGRFSADVDVA